MNRCFQGDQSYCQYITRDAGGTITAIYNLSFNLNELNTKGFDVELGYDRPIGDASRIGLRVLATRVSELTTVFVDGTKIDRAGPERPANLAAERRAGLARWIPVSTSRTGPFNSSLRVHWFTDGRYDNSLDGPRSGGLCHQPAEQHFEQQRVRVARISICRRATTSRSAVTRTCRSTVVINNLTDQDPPPAPSSTGAYNPTLFDPLGRMYRVGVRLNF